MYINWHFFLQEKCGLSEKLSKAESDLASVNRLSDELLSQKDELQRKANQDLENLSQKVCCPTCCKALGIWAVRVRFQACVPTPVVFLKSHHASDG